MKPLGPVAPARLDRDASGTPFSAAYGDVYHPKGGALAQAEHVYLRGHGVPQRWRGRERFVLLETGFGLGHNFLATRAAWRADPQRCTRLVFVSIENAPLSAADLADVHRDSPLESLAAELIAAWPPATPDLHRLDFDAGRVCLLLAFGDVDAWLPRFDAEVDAFDLDGFAPATNPAMWQPRLYKAMARLAAPGATVATWSAARVVRDGLSAAGFDVQSAPGQGGKRDITLARHAPRVVRAGAAARDNGEVVIVGAGLAGCAAAWALADAGRSCRVLDRHPQPAAGASGNPAGLFHGVIHADDGRHARFGRAASLLARQVVGEAVASGEVTGAAAGALRLVTDGTDVRALEAIAARLGLPREVARGVDATQASALAGVPLVHPAWWHAAGGWADPAALCRHLLDRAGAAAAFHGGVSVASLRRDGDVWVAVDEAGRAVARSRIVVLANAADAARLVPDAGWPITSSRGQLSWIDEGAAPPAPRIPVAGAGYLLPAVAGRIVFGATSDAGDATSHPIADDHRRNAEQVARLSPAWGGVDAARCGGRVARRCHVSDRLPLIGAVPDAGAALTRRDQPRFVARLPGLYVFTALGSRGIVSAPLGARLLAAQIAGAPLPIAADLRDALDPARFLVRRWRAAAG